jgi:hypothetical protein
MMTTFRAEELIHGERGRQLDAERLDFERALDARKLTPRGKHRIYERWLDGIDPPWWQPPRQDG